jgi:hypothetical protein
MVRAFSSEEIVEVAYGAETPMPANNPRSVRATPSADRWRWVPLAAALVTLAALPLTLGASTFLLPLISLALTVLALRRTASPRGFVVSLGLVANALVAIVLVASIVIYVHDALG